MANFRAETLRSRLFFADVQTNHTYEMYKIMDIFVEICYYMYIDIEFYRKQYFLFLLKSFIFVYDIIFQGDLVSIISFAKFKNSKEDDIMCEILKKINGKSSSELLREYGISLVPPIDISLLLRKIGIKEIPADFSEIEDLIEEERGSILGITYAKDESLDIFYRSIDTENRIRFTLAHELAHCCLHADTLKKRHIEWRKCETSNQSKEKEANIFAGELLIPLSSIEQIYSRFFVAPSLSALSSIFHVSTAVMAARLDYLKLTYIKDKVEDED